MAYQGNKLFFCNFGIFLAIFGFQLVPNLLKKDSLNKFCFKWLNLSYLSGCMAYFATKVSNLQFWYHFGTSELQFDQNLF